MQMQAIPHSRVVPAPCRVARRLLIIAMALSLLITLSIAADLLLRASHQGNEAGIWMQALSLSTPALESAGTPGRHPEIVHPAVDLRFSAGLECLP